MKVIPVVDVRGGTAVLAVGGMRHAYRAVCSVLTRSSEPVVLACALRDVLRRDTLYVALLDAIEGGTIDAMLVRDLAATGLHLWVDAGIRSVHEAQHLRDLGAERVIVASETISNSASLNAVVDVMGAERLVYSLDLSRGAPVGEGAGRSPIALVDEAYRLGIRDLILLDLEHVGSGLGAVSWAGELLEKLRPAAPQARWIVGGGCAGIDDLAALKAAGFDAALVGRAIHEGLLNADLLKDW
jgi:phosphoribosylformimino-5-aminoimidazole carboxamide ribotide isomerase